MQRAESETLSLKHPSVPDTAEGNPGIMLETVPLCLEVPASSGVLRLVSSIAVVPSMELLTHLGRAASAEDAAFLGRLSKVTRNSADETAQQCQNHQKISLAIQ